VPIGDGNLFWLVLESHGKVMEIDFAKRVVTLSIASNAYLISTFDNTLLHAVNSFCAGPYFEQCEYMFFPIFPYM